MVNRARTTLNDLKIFESNFDIVDYLPEHAPMAKLVKESLPELQRMTSFFGKTQSQFMDNMMTVSGPTPLRNIRQCLAEITRSKAALIESYFKIEKKKVEIKIKERDLENETDDLKKQLIAIEIMEMRSGLEESNLYISGAIRKIANHIEQIESIKKEKGITEFNEELFEEEEEKYHIMKAFEQALTAARSHHGIIDEGNHIYLYQIGINGAAAQTYISMFLQDEINLLKEKKVPHHGAVMSFLEQMAEQFKGCSRSFLSEKGMKKSEAALLKKGDERLLCQTT